MATPDERPRNLIVGSLPKKQMDVPVTACATEKAEQHVHKFIEASGGVLIGSRLFGLADESSDYDYVILYTPMLCRQFESLGFKLEDRIQDPHSYGIPEQVTYIYYYKDIHAVLVTSSQLFEFYIQFSRQFKETVVNDQYALWWKDMKQKLSSDDFRKLKRIVDKAAFKLYKSGMDRGMLLGIADGRALERRSGNINRRGLFRATK